MLHVRFSRATLISLVILTIIAIGIVGGFYADAPPGWTRWILGGLSGFFLAVALLLGANLGKSIRAKK
jgi:hypothetical protein